MFIAGSIGEEKTDAGTPASSQISQESDDQTPDSILKPSDVPELTLDHSYFTALPKYGDAEGIMYKDALPTGYRNVGEVLMWSDRLDRRVVSVKLVKHDSYSNSKLIELFTDSEDNYKEEFAKREHEPNTDYYWGDPHIGDCSWYLASTGQGTGTNWTRLQFIYNDNWVDVSVKDEKDKSKKEAIRVAKIIKSRLD